MGARERFVRLIGFQARAEPLTESGFKSGPMTNSTLSFVRAGEATSLIGSGGALAFGAGAEVAGAGVWATGTEVIATKRTREARSGADLVGVIGCGRRQGGASWKICGTKSAR